MSKDIRRALLVAKNLLPERPIEAHPAFSAQLNRRDAIAPADDKYRGLSDSRLKVWANRPDPITRADHILNGNTVTTPEDEVLKFPTREHAINYIDSMVGHWPGYADGGTVHPATQIPGVHISERIHGKPIFTEERAGRADGGRTSKFKLPSIRPSSDDVDEVLSSNMDHGRHVGLALAPLASLSGGVDLRQPDQRRRVDSLKTAMASPNGYISRLIVDDEGNVLEGQHRLEALRELGAAHAPVHRIADLSRGLDMDGIRAAINRARPLHPDHVTQLVNTALDNIHDEGGSVQKVRDNWEPPRGFEEPYNAVLDEVERQRAARPAKADGGTVFPDEAQADEGITAYQGGPHSVGPEGYDNAKIGTGEGNQSYGYGHYFAEHEPVATTYRGDPEARYKRYSGHMDPKEEFAFDLAARPDMRDWDIMKGLAEKYNDLDFDEAQRLATQAMAQRGHMHQVQIQGRPEHFLDWDKPLSEQSDHVKSALSTLPEHILKAANDIHTERTSASPHPPNGQHVYQNIARAIAPMEGMSSPLKATKLVSKMLLDRGIRGVRFLDQGSRDKGIGTRNYVVFDPKHIDIQRRYARGGMAYADGGSVSHLPSSVRRKMVDAYNETLPSTESQYRDWAREADDAALHKVTADDIESNYGEDDEIHPSDAEAIKIARQKGHVIAESRNGETTYHDPDKAPTLEQHMQSVVEDQGGKRPARDLSDLDYSHTSGIHDALMELAQHHGWRKQSTQGNKYFDLVHPQKGRIGVRIADHPNTSRQGPVNKDAAEVNLNLAPGSRPDAPANDLEDAARMLSAQNSGPRRAYADGGSLPDPDNGKITAYHASPKQLSEFKPSQARGATFFAPTPEGAVSGAGAGASDMTKETNTRPGGQKYIHKTVIDPKTIRGLHYNPEEIAWFNSLPKHIDGDDELMRIANENKPNSYIHPEDVYEGHPNSTRDKFLYVKKDRPPSISYKDAIDTGRDVYGRQHPHYAPEGDEARSAQRVLSEGMKGWLVHDEGGLSVAMADPSEAQIKEVTAHNPAKPRGYADGGSLPDAGVQKALDLTRDLNPQGLYSHAAEAAMASPQAKGPLPQMLASLKGVKPDELKYSGVNEAFAGKPRVTREELAQHFQQGLPNIQETTLREGGNESPPAYPGYTLPGGENYREVLLHLPDHSATPKFIDEMTPGELRGFIAREDRNADFDGLDHDQLKNLAASIVGPDAIEAHGLAKAQHSVADVHYNSHWPKHNVLAHLRLKDRTGPNGEKILHAEEVQSDWGQDARRAGTYDAIRPYQVFETNTGKVLSEHATPEEAQVESAKHRAAGHEGVDFGHAIDTHTDKEPVPNGPYIGSTQGWTDLALKRLLHEAAAGGYDKVVWTPGDQQAKRYSLTQQVKQIIAHHHPEGIGLDVYDHYGNKISRPRGLTQQQVAEHVGEGPAQKIAEGLESSRAAGSVVPRADIQGLDLEMGGEGMKGYYDKVVPKSLLALAKQHDPEAQIGSLPIQTDINHKPDPDTDGLYEELAGQPMPSASTFSHTLPSLTITPRMRESILKKGFKAYARGGDVEGTMRIAKAGGGPLDDDEAVKKALALTAQTQLDPTQQAQGPEQAVAMARSVASRPPRFSIMPPQAGTKVDANASEVPAGGVSIRSLSDAFNRALAHHLSLPRDERIGNSARAEQVVSRHVPGDLLGKNAKLLKTEEGKGDEPVMLPDGRGVETTGLALAPAYEEGRFTTCPNSASCKNECLGKTSGNYFKVGGGRDLSAFKGPRLNSLRKTIAFMRNPEAFAVKLHDEIEAAKLMAQQNGNHLGVRLNILSDINPQVYKSLMEAHPDVSFYDYTKNNTDPIASNHHYTYSSTGVSQPDAPGSGVVNENQNWKQMRKRLDTGSNVAMAFSNKEILPEEVHDAETGKVYKVINGDSHDFRPLDIQPDGVDGVVVGLKNKKATGKMEEAAKDSKGFFVHYDPQWKTDEKGGYLREASPGPSPNTGKPLRGPRVPQNRRVVISPQNRGQTILTNDKTEGKQ